MPLWIGCDPSRPSIVVTWHPSREARGVRQETTARWRCTPSAVRQDKRTAHAPQDPSPQPTLVPVAPLFRSHSLKGVRGETGPNRRPPSRRLGVKESILWILPLTPKSRQERALPHILRPVDDEYLYVKLKEYSSMQSATLRNQNEFSFFPFTLLPLFELSFLS